MKHWLMKSEPGDFSIDDLAAMPRKTEHWDGVRNYQVRNMMRDEMKKGDLAFFYHSSCAEPGIVGIVTICREGYPDHTAFDAKDKHFDPKSQPDNPRWYMVDVKHRKTLSKIITLKQLKQYEANKLKGFQLLKRGNRLSVMRVEKKHWDFIQTLF